MRPEEAVEHFKRLCRQLGSLANVGRHYRTKLGASSLPNYRKVILASGSEILSIRNPVQNNERRYIAGLDEIEEADRRLMRELGITPQYLSPAPALRTRAAEAHRTAA